MSYNIVRPADIAMPAVRRLADRGAPGRERSDGRLYGRFINGDRAALSAEQQAGLQIFRGRGNCVACHVGAPHEP